MTTSTPDALFPPLSSGARAARLDLLLDGPDDLHHVVPVPKDRLWLYFAMQLEPAPSINSGEPSWTDGCKPVLAVASTVAPDAGFAPGSGFARGAVLIADEQVGPLWLRVRSSYIPGSAFLLQLRHGRPELGEIEDDFALDGYSNAAPDWITDQDSRLYWKPDCRKGNVGDPERLAWPVTPWSAI